MDMHTRIFSRDSIGHLSLKIKVFLSTNMKTSLKVIRRALQRTKGNRTRAAELLEISHRALLYKIKDYRVDE